MGIRSPHRISFDPVTGELYGGDVGGNGREEVNRYVRGGNYGWAYYEGTLPTLAAGPEPAGVSPLEGEGP